MFNKNTKIKDSLAPPIENLLTDETFFRTTPTSASGRDISVRVGGVTRRSVVLSNNPASSSFRLLKATGLFNSSRFTRKVTISPASNYLETPGGGPSTKADFLTFDLSPPGGHAAYSVLSGSAALVNGIKSFGSPELAVNPITDPEKLLSPAMKHAISGLMYAAPLIKFGNYSWPVIRAGVGGVIPLIRGYKYGFYATQPASPNTVFRRDHYGYFSDLIETGPETATLGLINEDTGKEIVGWPFNDGPVKVTFMSRGGTPNIDPLDTNSQNLSTFSTSSLPYYDGMTVDRDVIASPPPDETDVTTLEEAVSTIIDGDA